MNRKFELSTKVKTLVNRVASENNIDPKMLMDVTDAYYKELYSHVKELKSPNIILIGLGRLVLSERKLTELIFKLESSLKDRMSRSHKAKSRYLSERRILLLKRGLENLKEINKKHEQQYNKRLEKQKENSGGNPE